MDKISVVICTRNRPQDIIRCIDSILIQTLLPNEIIIIDSSDTDDLKAELDSFGDRISVKYIHNIEAKLAQARNIGIDNSTGYIITFLDDDVILDKDCIRETKRIFDNDLEEKVGGVTGEPIVKLGKFARRVLRPVYQVFARVFLLLRHGDGRIQISGLPTTIRPGTADKPVKIEYVIGANMSFRRKVLNEFRFDEELPYFDDNDFPYRVSHKYEILYAPQARYVHNHAPEGQGRGILRYKRDMDGYHRYLKKNFPQTLKYRLIFYWSAIGWFIRDIIIRRMLSPILHRH